MINWLADLSLPVLYLLLAACGTVTWFGVWLLLRLAAQPVSVPRVDLSRYTYRARHRGVRW